MFAGMIVGNGVALAVWIVTRKGKVTL
jgi:hypothetical protein